MVFIISFLEVINLILSYLILSYLILSYLILSYLILSYPILSYLILSYLNDNINSSAAEANRNIEVASARCNNKKCDQQIV